MVSHKDVVTGRDSYRMWICEFCRTLSTTTEPSHHLPSCGENGHSVTFQLGNHNVTIFSNHRVKRTFQTIILALSSLQTAGQVCMKGLPLMGTPFMPTLNSCRPVTLGRKQITKYSSSTWTTEGWKIFSWKERVVVTCSGDIEIGITKGTHVICSGPANACGGILTEAKSQTAW